NSTTLEAIVPAGATTGIVTVDTDLDCDSEAVFTVITEETSECEGSTDIPGVPSGEGGLVFYEIFDRQGGSAGLLVILNASHQSIDLSNYQIGRSGDGSEGNMVDDWHIFTPMTLESGEVYIVGAGDLSVCPGFPAHHGISNGINEDDRFRIIR